MKKFKLFFALSISSTLVFADGATLFKKCTSCHGDNGGKKALGKSAIIAGRSASKTIKQLKAYKSGKLNKYSLGHIMKNQVSTMSDEDIEAIAKYISKLK